MATKTPTRLSVAEQSWRTLNCGPLSAHGPAWTPEDMAFRVGRRGGEEEAEVLPQPASAFRMSYCAYCIHERAKHTDDGPCQRCIEEGNGFWPECPRFTRKYSVPEERGLENPLLKAFGRVEP